jgi:phytol kinase
MTALMIMCGGDGIADLVGRRYPSNKLPYSPDKTVAGSISVFVGGWLLSAFVLGIYVGVGIFAQPFVSYLFPLAIIALVSMIVESLPFKDVDNITVTVVAALVGYLVF